MVPLVGYIKSFSSFVAVFCQVKSLFKYWISRFIFYTFIWPVRFSTITLPLLLLSVLMISPFVYHFCYKNLLHLTSTYFKLIMWIRMMKYFLSSLCSMTLLLLNAAQKIVAWTVQIGLKSIQTFSRFPRRFPKYCCREHVYGWTVINVVTSPKSF